MTPQIIVFLGNPGKEYQNTRHNVGWMVSGKWAANALWQKKFSGSWAKFTCNSNEVRLLKPETFMNLSGQSLQAMLNFFKTPLESCLVVHDDLELNFGKLVFQVGGGLGGHNGLKSISSQCGGKNFMRLRIGIGRPVHGSVSNYVLSRFSKEEEIVLPRIIEAADTILSQACTGAGTPVSSGKITWSLD